MTWRVRVLGEEDEPYTVENITKRPEILESGAITFVGSDDRDALETIIPAGRWLWAERLEDE